MPSSTWLRCVFRRRLEYGALWRWALSLGMLEGVLITWSIRLYLRAGRLWLLWLICGLRALMLVLNFVPGANFYFREITSLQPMPLLGELISRPHGVLHFWTMLMIPSLLLIVLFAIDAAHTAYKRSGRRRAWVLGGLMAVGFSMVIVCYALYARGILPSTFSSQPFLLLILLMGYELSIDVLRAGQLSRELVESQQVWMQLYGKPPAQVPMSAESKKLLTEALIFRPRPEVGRAIFISAPLRGSDLATDWVGRLGSSFVKLPVALLRVGNEELKSVTFTGDDLRLTRMPNSVDTFSPKNRFVKAINTVPITPGIPHHVISGDRGKGGNKDSTKPVMSDGIVPYWSSHMDGAVSELVVPSSHSAHQNPQAIAEVKRILKRYAKSSLLSHWLTLFPQVR